MILLDFLDGISEVSPRDAVLDKVGSPRFVERDLLDLAKTAIPFIAVGLHRRGAHAD